MTYSLTSGTLESGDNFSGELARAAGENVGDFTINQGTLDNSNYDITFVSNDFSIGKKTITVTVDSKTKIYGESDPELTYQASLLGGDIFTGGISRATGENVGDYAVNSTLANSNYSINFVSTNFSITKRPVTITANEASKVSGEADPSFTYQLTSGSLANGDVFTGSLSRTPGELVGFYDLLIGDLTLGSNYELTLNSNQLAISLVLTTGFIGRSSKAIIIEGQVSNEINVIERGIIYSATNMNPELGGTDVTKVVDDTVTGPFFVTINGLASTTTYYFQTYIIINSPSGKSIIIKSAKSSAETNLYGGVIDFETLTEEPTLSTVSSLIPAVGTKLVDPTSNFEINFDQAIQRGIGQIEIRNSNDNNLIESIDVSSSNIVIDNQKLTINPTSDMPQVTEVYINIPVGAMEDLLGNGWTGLLNKTDWSFTTDDTVAPTITAISPTNSSIDIAPDSNLEITFSEELTKGSGNILIKNSNDNSIVTTIDVTSNLVSINNNIVTINPQEDLPSERSFYIEIANTVFKDTYDNNYLGISTSNIWQFTTADITAPLKPIITSVADYTCTETTLATADNTFTIIGTAEAASSIDVYLNSTFVGTSTTDSAGDWVLDLDSTTQADGDYTVYATATDNSNNISDSSDTFDIIVSTTNSDLDNIPDFCDSDAENDGYVDATQITEKTKYGFSPNGDGINDTWTIRDIENFDNNSVKVYNRSGRLVYAKDNYDNTWDGTSSAAIGNGKLPVGAYYFTIDLKVDGMKMVSGWIYINY